MSEREWMPIETAPKDGSDILLWTSDQVVHQGFWDANTTNFYKSQEGWASYDPDNAKGEWISLSGPDDDRRMYCGMTPTHWMSLPSPPKDTAHE